MEILFLFILDLFRAHELSHKGERPFLCSLCPKTFNIIDNLRQHVERFHKVPKTGKKRGRKSKVDEPSSCSSETEEEIEVSESLGTMRSTRNTEDVGASIQPPQRLPVTSGLERIN
jgi:uncharacterized Zn-finger protein